MEPQPQPLPSIGSEVVVRDLEIAVRSAPLRAPNAERLALRRDMMSPANPPGGDRSDVELMERVARGEVDAFERIVERYWGGTLIYIRHITNDRDSAYDVSQEAFSRLWKKREEWSGSGSVRVWLLRTARNIVFSERRHWKVRARRALELAREYRPVRTPLQQAEASELREAIHEAVQQLSPRRREAFTLFHLQGLSYREVSEIMGVRSQTVANYLQSALRDLRQMLGPRFAGDDTLESEPDSGAPR